MSFTDLYLSIYIIYIFFYLSIYLYIHIYIFYISISSSTSFDFLCVSFKEFAHFFYVIKFIDIELFVLFLFYLSHICIICGEVTSPISHIVNFWLPSCFLRFVNIIDLFNKPTLSSNIFCIVFCLVFHCFLHWFFSVVFHCTYIYHIFFIYSSVEKAT